VTPFRVVVVGGGFSGVATTVALLRHRPHARPLALTILERSGSVGPGVAYSTPDRRHLLNVPAERMSALPDRPDHFAAWAAARGASERYLPRALYGDYLQSTLAAAERAAPPGTVRHVTDEAVRLVPGPMPGDATIVTRAGMRLPADAVVLATGVARPATARLEAMAGHPAYVADPWDHDRVARLAGACRVLVVGTGLTTVDVALTLAGGPEIVAVSRHGLMPAAHAVCDPPTAPPAVRPGECTTADALAARVETAARSADWRAVVDGLRPVTQALWRGLPDAEQRRFVEHHSRRWETVRSRMAPAVAEEIAALRARGALRVLAAGIERIQPLPGDRLAVTLSDGRRLEVDGIVNATGPAWDPRAGDSVLLHALLADGLAAPGPVGLGLRTGPDGRLAGSDVFALGALRRGELWESVAVPELREQAAGVAEEIRDRAAEDSRVAVAI
jgi:uncharacterized NAD(P)/FAD-binding protein YdhS